MYKVFWRSQTSKIIYKSLSYPSEFMIWYNSPSGKNNSSFNADNRVKVILTMNRHYKSTLSLIKTNVFCCLN